MSQAGEFIVCRAGTEGYWPVSSQGASETQK